MKEERSPGNNSAGLPRKCKEQLLAQKGLVVWLTGLSGAGKTTIARELEQELYSRGILTQLLDGDDLRSGINANLGFTSTDREENIRRAAEIARLFARAGVVTICSFISPTEKIRQLARRIVGDPDYVEVFVNTPLEICEDRDVKGLYKKARSGEIGNFTGVHSPYEVPHNPALELRPETGNLHQLVRQLMRQIERRIILQEV